MTSVAEATTVMVSYGETQIEEDIPAGAIKSITVNNDLRLNDIGERDKGVQVESLNGQAISVVGLSEEITSADSFCILPTVFLPAAYEYFAVSVPRTELTIESDGVVEPLIPQERSAFLIVSTEDATVVSMTLTQTVSTSNAPDLRQFGSAIAMGETVTFTLNKAQTLYISSIDDLTGSKVVSNKPLTFLSGHECGTIPQSFQYCDQMVEQIPPTATWGTTFYTAPFLTRTGYAVKMVAAQDDTTINVICSENQERITLIISNAGGVVLYNTSQSERCQFESNRPILLIQFSLAGDFDQNTFADPFMVLISPVQQYSSEYLFQPFSTTTNVNEAHYINVIIPAAYDRFGALLNGVLALFELWEPIPCNSNPQLVCAYAAGVSISSGSQFINHTNPDARFSVIVYTLGFRAGRGYSAGMTQRPIACTFIYRSLNRCTIHQLHVRSFTKSTDL